MFRRLLVPLDGSGLAERTIPHAVFLSRLMGIPIHLVRVIDNDRLERRSPFGLALEHAAYERARSIEEAECQVYLARLESDLIERGLNVTDEIRCGEVAREIIAAINPDDLVVIATHGRGGVTRWLIGSVAEDIVRRSPAPVLLIPFTLLSQDTVVPGVARIDAQ